MSGKVVNQVKEPSYELDVRCLLSPGRTLVCCLMGTVLACMLASPVVSYELLAATALCVTGMLAGGRWLACFVLGEKAGIGKLIGVLAGVATAFSLAGFIGYGMSAGVALSLENIVIMGGYLAVCLGSENLGL